MPIPDALENPRYSDYSDTIPINRPSTSSGARSGNKVSRDRKRAAVDKLCCRAVYILLGRGANTEQNPREFVNPICTR